MQGDMTRLKVQGEPFIRERVCPLEFFDREVSLTMQSDGQGFREGQAVVDPETGWADVPKHTTPNREFMVLFRRRL